ncbi:MAG: hypothetical protein E2590_04935 [Chryseobacterium sp.]|nr:hypothetical protein [Chryseobacterium sp.]
MMFKTKNLSALFLLISLVFYSQTRLPGASGGSGGGEGSVVNLNKEVQLKKDIDDVGLTVANRLMNCCSTWGGKNVYSQVDYSDVRQNTTTGAFTVPMVVGWYGSLTGTHYWIQGKLIINSNGSKEWLKTNDSGGFKSGCSRDCSF